MVRPSRIEYPGAVYHVTSPGDRREPIAKDDIDRVALLSVVKEERNQNIANAFYQGGHSQTAIALAFDISSSTLSRVIKGYENGGWMA